MKERNNIRRGVALGVATLTGLSAAALSVVGISEHADLTAQRDVALVNAADDAHNALIDAQVAQDHSLFSNDVAEQQSIYYWAQQNNMLNLFYPDTSASDPANTLFNGAFSRFTESNLVSQAMMQAQLDHMLGVNQTAGIGGVPPGPDGGSPGGYETEIANALYADLHGAGIPASGPLTDAIDALNLAGADPVDVTSFSAFQGALTDLQSALMQSAWSDLFGMFSVDVTP